MLHCASYYRRRIDAKYALGVAVNELSGLLYVVL